MSLLLEFARRLFADWLTLSLAERWIVAMLVVGSPSVWLFETIRYWRLLRKDPNTVALAPVSVRGRLLEDLGPGGVASILRTELASIREALQRVLGDRPAPYIAPALGRDTGYYLVGLRHEGPIPLDIREPDMQKVEQSITVRVGPVTIPVSETIELLIAIVGALPVPWRARYKRSLVNVALVNIGEQTRLTVWQSRPRRAADEPGSHGHQPASAVPLSFTETVPTKTLEDVVSLVRDAAFMILELNGTFKGRRWRSMRHLLDGLVSLDDYRRTAAPEAREQARRRMRAAAEADPDNREAVYFHGVMTMVDQTDGAIDEAIRCFEHAGGSSSGRLLTLVYTSLAYCKAQQWHRLGRRRREVLDEAAVYAQKAQREWTNLSERRRGGTALPMHPLIPYTKALVTTVDEGNDDTDEGREDRERRFTAAFALYKEAIVLQPDNGMFHNNLGWVLTKLAEWGIAALRSDQVRDVADNAPVPQLAEHYLQRALGMNPHNKLTHANLCLLYSTETFRREPDRVCLARARYHGLKAISIDAGYVNGHRDLAVALIRYGELDAAYVYFTKALALADLPAKDRELIGDLVREVSARPDVSRKELLRWQNPAAYLLDPGGAPTAVASVQAAVPQRNTA
jgi:tetratricopeptide (TPR) repeat protein